MSRLEVIMKKHAVISGVGAILLVATAGCGEQSQTAADIPMAGDPAIAEPTSPDVDATAEEPAGTAPATPTTSLSSAKFVPPIHGIAEVELTKPVTRRVGNEIVTTMRVKNTSTTNSIAGLRVDDYWYNTAGAPVTGNTFRQRKPVQPGEVIEVTLRTPVSPRMDRNQYRFTHANGDIKTTVVPELDASE
jgi:hypothetical protein